MSTSPAPDRRPASAFLALGITFLVLGFTTPAFLVLGFVFLTMSLGLHRKSQNVPPDVGPDAD